MRIADSHVHLKNTDRESVRALLDNAAAAGVSELSLLSLAAHPGYGILQNLLMLRTKQEYKKIKLRAFGSFHERDIYGRIPYEEQLRALVDLGCDGIKFIHMKPNIRKMIGKGLDDSSYDAALSMLEDMSLPVVLHSGDPENFWDITQMPKSLIDRGWFYGDGTYPSCEEHYNEVYRMLDKHPRLKISIAHFFFLSNKKEEAVRVMETYPNVYFDLTPGWEMFVGFSRDIDFWRDFFIKYSDRILFGTDTSNEKENSLNTKLYELVYSAITHDTTEFAMPCYGGHIIKGLELPCDVVRKICYENYEGFVSGEPAPVSADAIHLAARRLCDDVRGTEMADSIAPIIGDFLL